jgi:hypothetical protein
VSERTTDVALALMRMALGLLDQGEHHAAGARLHEAIDALTERVEAAQKTRG